jgi:hypothetical protein
MEPNLAISIYVSPKMFSALANQKKELLLPAMFICRMEPNQEVL